MRNRRLERLEHFPYIPLNKRTPAEPILKASMRRTLAISLLALLAVPAAAWAAPAVPNDGTLSVRNGDGTLTLDMTRGAAIGKIEQGRIVVDVAEAEDCGTLAVFGEESSAVSTRGRFADIQVCIFAGKQLRFRLVGADVRFSIVGEFSVSIVAKARGWIRGKGGVADGLYSVDGEEYASLPDERKALRLGPAAFATAP
jgi:hypothetical protein